MRGYLSFVLVLICLLVIFYLLELQITFDFSKAIAVQRTYSVQMNVKESIFESVKQGASEGFHDYDLSHSTELCKHCPDHFCIPSSPTNHCDPILCAKCFREDEARNSAVNGALSKLQLISTHIFDPDFDVSISTFNLSVYLKPDSLSQNGFSLDYTQFRKEILIGLSSEKFDISAEARIPKGCVLYDEGPSIC
ncbi:hypothetical protein KKB44_05770 [Candidatus Micrarchaeota archaeon]|nr:hypothetical protein [Candidatus Micrarchaeota archaeon]